MSGRRRNKRKKWIIAVLIVLALLVAGGFFCVKYFFRIKEVNISGSDKYTYDQIYKYVFEGKNSANTLLFKHDYKKNRNITIPFIAKVDVEVKLPDTINVKVYDKNIVGYVKYKNANMYFDKDGIITDSSMTVLDKIPLVEGLNYESIVMNKPLLEDNDAIFTSICDITQYLSKYDMYIDALVVNKDESMTIKYADVMVELGKCDNTIADKIYELSCMKEQIKNLKGILYLDKYDKETKKVFFKETQDIDDEVSPGESTPPQDENGGESSPPQDGMQEGSELSQDVEGT